MVLDSFSKKTFLLAALFCVFSSFAVAETKCETKDCKITITIKLEFLFDTGVNKSLADEWKKEIEDVWNGDGRVCGDCKCPVSFKVEVKSGNYNATSNCSNATPGYHCVIVTHWPDKKPSDTSGNTYPGYMYPPGVTNGSSITGWWSDSMSREDPSNPGGNYRDAAHEAGHMMGLQDDYNKSQNYYGANIMGNTSGENAKPTQDQIDQVVKNVCGPNACPDNCCCGNGEIEPDKGEGCDPMAEPNGCPSEQFCCKICCNCHSKQCDPEKGSYATKADCEKGCEDGSCYYNYNTGCWDCVKHNIQATPVECATSPQANPDCSYLGGQMSIYDLLELFLSRKDLSLGPELLGFLDPYLEDLPQNLVELFDDKRINLVLTLDPEGYALFPWLSETSLGENDEVVIGAVVEDGSIVEANLGGVEEPSLIIYADLSDCFEIATSEDPVAVFEEKLSSGQIVYEVPAAEAATDDLVQSIFGNLFGGLFAWLFDLF